MTLRGARVDILVAEGSICHVKVDDGEYTQLPEGSTYVVQRGVEVTIPWELLFFGAIFVLALVMFS